MNGAIGAVLLAENHFKRVVDFVDNDGFIGGADGLNMLTVHGWTFKDSQRLSY